MTANPAPRLAPRSAAAMLDKVYRDLVQIHESIAEATRDDREIMPWTMHELMALIREVQSFRGEQRAEVSPPDRTPDDPV